MHHEALLPRFPVPALNEPLTAGDRYARIYSVPLITLSQRTIGHAASTPVRFKCNLRFVASLGIEPAH